MSLQVIASTVEVWIHVVMYSVVSESFKWICDAISVGHMYRSLCDIVGVKQFEYGMKVM